MRLVIDANILFSALIKNSKTADLIFDESIQLYTPEFLFTELNKYSELILKKTSRTEKDLNEVLMFLKSIIKIFPKEEYAGHIKKAQEISPDPNDVAYLALALKLKCSIWSNDKLLKNQDEIQIYNTTELLEII